MKRYIKSAYEPTFKGTWSEEDIELWKSIDWKARNYEEYPVENEFDSFITGEVTVYGIEDHGISIPCTFQKVLRANPIYPPYYRILPEDLAAIEDDYPDYALVGPMYDGNKHGEYKVHDRLETQEVYDVLTR